MMRVAHVAGKPGVTSGPCHVANGGVHSIGGQALGGTLTARTGESCGDGIFSRTRTHAPVVSSGSCSLYSACSPALRRTWVPLCPTSGARAPLLLCAFTSAATSLFPRFCNSTADQHDEL